MPANPFPIAAAGFAAIALTSWMLPQYGQASDVVINGMTVVQADKANPGILIAGTATAVLFRSRDGADTWDLLPFPAASRGMLHSILINPKNSDVYMVAVTSEISRYAGVYRSKDRGATWEQLRDLREKQVWSLAFWDGDSRVVAAGAEDGVYLTRDGGETWSSVSSPGSNHPQPVVSLAFDPVNRNVMYAGTPHLAFKTIDGGSNWSRIGAGIPEDSDIFWIEVDWRQPKRLYLGACSGIYRSFNSGGNWASLIKSESATFRTYVVVRAPGTTDTVFAGTSSGLLQSVNGGSTWRVRLPQTVRSMVFDPFDARRMFFATDQGILRSEDGGGHFEEASRGLRIHLADNSIRTGDRAGSAFHPDRDHP